jgi:hypothetical protein
MWNGILNPLRHFHRKTATLQVFALEERLTPATANLPNTIDVPPLVVVNDFRLTPTPTDAATKPIVRLDVMPNGASPTVDADNAVDAIAWNGAENGLFANKPSQKAAAMETTPPIEVSETELFAAYLAEAEIEAY